MLTAKEVAKTLRDVHPYLSSEYGVKRIGLFGSFARGAATEASDIDLLIEFERPIGFKFFELTEYLEDLLGKSVDVLTPAGIRAIRIERIARDIEESVVYVS